MTAAAPELAALRTNLAALIATQFGPDDSPEAAARMVTAPGSALWDLLRWAGGIGMAEYDAPDDARRYLIASGLRRDVADAAVHAFLVDA